MRNVVRQRRKIFLSKIFTKIELPLYFYLSSDVSVVSIGGVYFSFWGDEVGKRLGCDLV